MLQGTGFTGQQATGFGLRLDPGLRRLKDLDGPWLKDPEFEENPTRLVWLIRGPSWTAATNGAAGDARRGAKQTRDSA